MESWIGLLPILLMVLVIGGVAWYISKRMGPQMPGPSGEQPYGVRGWLAFYVYVSCTLAPLRSVIDVNRTFNETESKVPQVTGLDSWNNYKTAVWLMTTAAIVWQVWVAVRLKRKLEPRSVFLVKVFLIAAPIAFGILDGLAGYALLSATPTAQEIGQTMGLLLANCIWVLYFSRSKRVRNTYGLVQDDQAPQQTSAPRTELLLVADATPAQHPVALEASRLNAPLTDLASTHNTTAPTLEERMLTLTRLRDQGLISSTEFDTKKADLLAKL